MFVLISGRRRGTVGDDDGISFGIGVVEDLVNFVSVVSVVGA